MATLVKYMEKLSKITDEIFENRSLAEQERQREYEAVVKVQAWFRASRTRKYLGHLDRCALTIQKKWRGFLGRKYYRQVLKDQVFIMKLNHYNFMATKIQKVWKGFYCRKYIANYYSRKRYLEGLMVKNDEIRTELEDHVEQEEMLRQIKREKVEKQRLDDYAEKHHYLISTQVMPGIFNSPYQQYPDEMEFHLRNAKPKPSHKPKEEKSNIFDPGWRRYDLPQREPLPPVQPKPQGPFRSPREVQQQRYKAWQPSLRVATNFYSLEEAREKMKQEEWVNRLHDNTFLPFKRRSSCYEPLLHSQSKFGHPPYGTRYFRHEYADKWLMKQNFHSVVPPIPIFEKLNDTYSQGQV